MAQLVTTSQNVTGLWTLLLSISFQEHHHQAVLWSEQAVQLPRDRPSWPGGSPFQKVLSDNVPSEPLGRHIDDIHLDDNR